MLLSVPPALDAGRMSTEDGTITLDQVLKKEKEVSERRAALEFRLRAAERVLSSTVPNFPPKLLCLHPVVYHDIDVEVPPERQRFARFCFVNYWITFGLIIWNIATSAAGFGTPDSAPSSTSWGTQFGVSFLYLLGIPGAFVVWYFSIYTALSKRMGSKYSLSFLGLVVAFIFNVFIAVGILGYGGCGWLFTVAASSTKANAAPMVMGLINSIGWSVQAGFFVYMIGKIKTFSVVDKIQKLEARRSAQAVPAPGAAGVNMPQ
jgi:hypothetical protein